MIALRERFTRTQVIGGAVLASGLALAGIQAMIIQSTKPDVFDPSTVDICSPNTLCDNTQIKVGMRDGNGHISISSPIGKTLSELSQKHTGGKISDANVVDLMTRFESVLTHAMPAPTVVAVNGMMLYKAPQNPGLKSRYGVHAFIQDGTGCAAYEIKVDGRPVSAAIPMPVSSHSAPVPGCAREIDALNKAATRQFAPL